MEVKVKDARIHGLVPFRELNIWESSEPSYSAMTPEFQFGGT